MLFKSTAELKIPSSTVEQVIGQEHAVNIIKKAARQRRHVLLIGEPGTGKSMLGLALARLLPKENLVDVVSLLNPHDEHQPLIRTLRGGKARGELAAAKAAMNSFKLQNFIFIALFLLAMIAPWLAFNFYSKQSAILGGIMFSAFFIGGLIFLISLIIFFNINRRADVRGKLPKIIVDNFKKDQAPFFDATGARSGALLGDVLHDPFQSGGLGTPPHERVIAGMIHKANLGVLFIDEIATLEPQTQQELLTAIQEGRFSITGQNERSAGALVHTEPVPCRFVLVAAGNVETIAHMHPALRSRIRGYGYEVFMKDTMPDTPKNREKLALFIAQEVRRSEGKLPHFSKGAVDALITEAKRRASRKGQLTLLLRDLGGLIRASGDLALEEKQKLVQAEHIKKARLIARTLEQQIADKVVENRKAYEVIITTGKKIGRVNGLAVLGGEGSLSGIILPIEAEVTAGGEASEIIATGNLGDIAKEAIKNVSAIVKKHFGEDIKKKHDLFVQFLQTYQGVEGDSASIAVAASIISALKQIPVLQHVAITGSLSVRGEVLPVGGVSSKVEAAIDAGIKKVIVPRTNLKDIVLDKAKQTKITLIPVDTIGEALKEALDWKGNEKLLKKLLPA